MYICVLPRPIVWCMYIFVCTYVYSHVLLCGVCTYLYVHMCTLTSYCVVYVHVCMYICVLSRPIMWCMYMFVCTYVYSHVLLCGVCTYLYVRMCTLTSYCVVYVHVCMYICVLSRPIMWCILPLTPQDKSDSEMERIKSTVLLCYGYVTYHSPPQLVWGRGGCEGGGVGCVVVRVEGIFVGTIEHVR